MSPIRSLGLALFVALVVFVPMLIEARRAAGNERAQRARGGVEPDGDVYRAMRWAYPAAFLLMIGDGWIRGVGPGPTLMAGLVVFIAAKTLKWWAIVSLGQCWTFRIIVVPGARLVSGGPYKWLRHPNYVAVIGELLGVMTMTRSFAVGLVATAAFGWLIVRRLAVEERALRS